MAPILRSLVYTILASTVSAWEYPAGIPVLTPNRALATSSDNEVLAPRNDPFYTAPNDFASAVPGQILRMRPAPGNLTTVVKNSTAAYNILYRTTNSQYKPDWAVTTLFIPQDPGSNDVLLSYQEPYDSADVDASPSFATYAGPSTDVPLALGQGWYVNVPDYEGPRASFTAGVQSGHATLDSIRAVLNSNHGLIANPKIAMWGYSGGALASEWAAELQLKYAPELKFVGAALGGLTPNITSVLLSVNGKATAGLNPAGIVGITSQFPAARQYIVDNLKKTGKYNATTFLGAVNETLVESITTFIGQDISNYFKNGINSLLSPIITKITNSDGIMGTHGTPQMPVFAYKAIGDEVSKISDTDALVNKLCSQGANIWYQRNTVGGHEAESTNGDMRAFEWLTGVFTGYYSTFSEDMGCTIEDVTVAITTSTL